MGKKVLACLRLHPKGGPGTIWIKRTHVSSIAPALGGGSQVQTTYANDPFEVVEAPDEVFRAPVDYLDPEDE